MNSKNHGFASLYLPGSHQIIRQRARIKTVHMKHQRKENLPSPRSTLLLVSVKLCRTGATDKDQSRTLGTRLDKDRYNNCLAIAQLPLSKKWNLKFQIFLEICDVRSRNFTKINTFATRKCYLFWWCCKEPKISVHGLLILTSLVTEVSFV